MPRTREEIFQERRKLRAEYGQEQLRGVLYVSMLQTLAKRPARPIPAPSSKVKQYIFEILRPGQPFRRNEVISRVLVSAAVILSRLQTPAIAAQESVTPDQIIARYLHAIGAEQIPSITTFVERGEIQNTITNPNLTNPGRLSVPPPALPQRGRYENYFKSPNLRFSSTISENNLVMGLHGCDGKVAWYIDNSLKRQEFTPKPGQEYECENGFTLSPLQRDEHTKIRLAGKVKMEGRVAWEIKVENPKSHSLDTYYFDAETYLLLRYKGRNHTVTLSDYREVSGIRRPFTVIRENDYFRATITVREVQVNVPSRIPDLSNLSQKTAAYRWIPSSRPQRAKTGPQLPPRQRCPSRLVRPRLLKSITQISVRARLQNFKRWFPIFAG